MRTEPCHGGDRSSGDGSVIPEEYDNDFEQQAESIGEPTTKVKVWGSLLKTYRRFEMTAEGFLNVALFCM